MVPRSPGRRRLLASSLLLIRLMTPLQVDSLVPVGMILLWLVWLMILKEMVVEVVVGVVVEVKALKLVHKPVLETMNPITVTLIPLLMKMMAILPLFPLKFQEPLLSLLAGLPRNNVFPSIWLDHRLIALTKPDVCCTSSSSSPGMLLGTCPGFQCFPEWTQGLPGATHPAVRCCYHQRDLLQCYQDFGRPTLFPQEELPLQYFYGHHASMFQ